MEVLTLTTLYPNAVQPRHGIFVQNRLSAMDKIKNFKRKVIAPVPHCPMVGMISDRYKLYENVPEKEVIDNIDVYHPRYFTLPGISFFDNAKSIAKSANETIEHIYSNNGDFDLIDGQYLYPDGVAAYHIARDHNKPLILTARGSDVNYWMQNQKAKAQILEAIDYASSVICVSGALKDALIGHGVSEDKINVIINGVDPQVFNVDVKANPLREKYFLSVGNLIPLKGHDITLNAFYELSKTRLIIVGNGEQKRELKKQAKNLGIQGRVQFINHLDQSKLAELYAGATATILMSSMEGMPNVVLESLAVGTPVIACEAGGVAEVLNSANGILLKSRHEFDLIKAVEAIGSFSKTRVEISETVKSYRWSDAALRQHDLYQKYV